MVFCVWLLSLSKTSLRYIHTVAWIRSLFLPMVKLRSTVWTYCILFIHSSVHGHLGSSHLLHIMNRVVMIMCVRFAWKRLSGTDKFCGNSMFMYWRIIKVFSTMLLNFKDPEAMYEGSDFSTCSLTFLFLGMNKKYIYYFIFGASWVSQLVKNPPAMQNTPVGSLGQEVALEKWLATHSSILGLP